MNRRGFIFGAGATLAIIPAARLMKIAVLRDSVPTLDLTEANLLAVMNDVHGSLIETWMTGESFRRVLWDPQTKRVISDRIEPRLPFTLINA